MKTEHPTRDELLAMAYVDDQLADAERRAFQARLATEPELAREVAELQGLAVFARRAAPPEPIDVAWQHIDEDPLQKGAVSMGWLLAIAGLCGLSLLLAIALWQARISPWFKISSTALTVGLALLFVAVLRRRIESRAFDPYTSVKR